MVGEASGRMQKADCRDEIALPAAMLAWLKYRKQRTRNSRKRFLVFFCSLFVKARVVYRLPSGRKLNKNLINRLATCEYISEHRNLFITGATGCGKTYMACAFGMEACKQYFNTRYVRLPDLLIDLEMARTDGSYKKVMAKYANPVVLILDEWLLLKPTDSEQRDIFELLHRRRKKSSTIFCSQYEFEEWYDQLGGDDSPLADAIIDRIAHDSYRINITSIDAEHDKSMREVYGLDKALRE